MFCRPLVTRSSHDSVGLKDPIERLSGMLAVGAPAAGDEDLEWKSGK